MAGGTRPGGGRSAEAGSDEAPEAVDLQDLARDWITMWQSELAAMATDRELQEGWQALLALWAGAATVFARGLPRERPGERQPERPPERASGRTGAAPPARTATAAAAPDARDAEIERLGRRVAELEQRLAGVERGVRPSGGARRRGGRKRPG